MEQQGLTTSSPANLASRWQYCVPIFTFIGILANSNAKDPLILLKIITREKVSFANKPTFFAEQ